MEKSKCERLKELRLERNLTIHQLATAIGVSDIAISRWENNLREPKLESVIALAQYFGVTIEYLLGLED